MSKHIKTKRALEDARREYVKAMDLGDGIAAQRASAVLRDMQSQLGAAIAEGAKACPFCGTLPHGLEQPRVINNRYVGLEYEVGCLACAPFKHSDGTTRKVGTRGGLLPTHTVEAWNAGPDYWTILKG